MKENLIKFIKIGLRNKWENLNEEELDSIISSYIQVEEVHVGNELLTAVKHAVIYEEISSGKIKDLLKWGESNLQDLDFWDRVKYTVNNFKPKAGYGILILILHFENKDDAVLFTMCWK